MKSILNLVRKNIKDLSAYSSARSLFKEGILLDANESSFEILSGKDQSLSLNRYPDGSNSALRAHLASLFNLQSENLALGNGSDEIIDLLIRIFCQPLNDSILILPPTFGMYKVAAKVNEVNIIEVLNPDSTVSLLENIILPASLPVKEILEKSKNGVKIIFICNPNNPTGISYNRKEIQEIVEKVNCLVVVDEAYGEFIDQESMVPELPHFGNLVVLKTLSKAYALAGIRMGMALASSEIISLIQKVKMPYNLNSLTTNMLLNCSDLLERKSKNVAQILVEKEDLKKNLEKLKIIKAIVPSAGNFFLVRFINAEIVFDGLVDMGIIVRKVDSSYGMDSCLRISVGNKDENQALISALVTIQNKTLFPIGL